MSNDYEANLSHSQYNNTLNELQMIEEAVLNQGEDQDYRDGEDEKKEEATLNLVDHEFPASLSNDGQSAEEKPLPKILLNAFNDQPNPEKTYRWLEELLFRHIDLQDGIITTPKLITVTKTGGVNYTKHGYYRNATEAYSLDTQLSRDHDVFKCDNMLLRTLTTARAVDHALQYLLENHAGKLALVNILESNRDTLFEKIKNLFIKAIAKNDSLDDIEKEFNADLIGILHACGLTEGINNNKAAEKLLIRYRYLSSLVDPARLMQTVTYDKDFNATHTETYIPITNKTPEQKKELAKMNIVDRCPQPEDKNYQTTQKIAFQKANAAFGEHAQKDDYRLPAQARKFIPHGVKNGYVVCNVIKFNEGCENENETETTHWSMRCATIAYIGNGESKASEQDSAKQNSIQLRRAAKEFAGADEVHFTILNTYSPLQSQYKMVDRTIEAFPDMTTYVPINLDGTNRFIDRSPHVIAAANQSQYTKPPGWASKPSQKGKRTEQAAKIIVIAGMPLNYTGTDKQLLHDLPKTINITACASGQDRTGTTHEAVMILWSTIMYAISLNPSTTIKAATQPGVLNHHLNQIEIMRAAGGATAVATSLSVPGSPGIKPNSKPGYFQADTERHLYLKSADTNKRCHASRRRVEPTLVSESPFLLARYEGAKTSLEQTLQHKRLVQRVIRTTDHNRKLNNLGFLCDALERTADAITFPNNENTEKLSQLEKHCSKRKLYKKLGAVLGVVVGITLITAGIMLAIPSGGSSLLGALVCVKTLSSSLGIGCTIATAGAGVAAASGVAVGSRSCRFFQSELAPLGSALNSAAQARNTAAVDSSPNSYNHPL